MYRRVAFLKQSKPQLPKNVKAQMALGFEVGAKDILRIPTYNIYMFM